MRVIQISTRLLHRCRTGRQSLRFYIQQGELYTQVEIELLLRAAVNSMTHYFWTRFWNGCIAGLDEKSGLHNDDDSGSLSDCLSCILYRRLADRRSVNEQRPCRRIGASIFSTDANHHVHEQIWDADFRCGSGAHQWWRQSGLGKRGRSQWRGDPIGRSAGSPAGSFWLRFYQNRCRRPIGKAKTHPISAVSHCGTSHLPRTAKPIGIESKLGTGEFNQFVSSLYQSAKHTAPPALHTICETHPLPSNSGFQTVRK